MFSGEFAALAHAWPAAGNYEKILMCRGQNGGYLRHLATPEFVRSGGDECLGVAAQKVQATLAVLGRHSSTIEQ